MAVYAIGDVQGCFEPLQRLVRTINYQPGRDVLWFCGDLVNRGPESAATLRWIKQQGDSARCVLGNHDMTLLAVAEGFAKSGHKDTFNDVLRAPDGKKLIRWLRQQPLLHHDSTIGYTMVHAGLPPPWDLTLAMACAAEVSQVLRGPHYRSFLRVLFGSQPDRWDPALRGNDRWRYIVNALTRIRFCLADGTLSMTDKGPPGTQRFGYRPWFDWPGRRSSGLNLVFGHWAALDYYREPGLVALDTGCVWGRRLTALRIDSVSHPVSVPRFAK